MGVINQQSNTRSFCGIFYVKLNTIRFLLFPLLFKQFLVELDEQQSLVADICEEIVLPDEIKYVGPPQS